MQTTMTTYARISTQTITAYIPTAGWPKKETISLIETTWGFELDHGGCNSGYKKAEDACGRIERIFKGWAARDASIGTIPGYAAKK